MMRILFVCSLLFSVTVCWAQLIVNVENSRIQSDSAGWEGEVGTAFSFTKNVKQILNINATAHLQYKNEKNLYLLLANYNLLKGDEEELTNNSFYHLRYNRKVNNLLHWEAFTQWQQNSITNIELRALVGTGARFRLHQSARTQLFLGVLAMYEHEKDLHPTVVHKDFRSDNYVSFTYEPNPVFDITTTTFYQPLFRKFSDFRLLNQITFNIKATKHFSIVTSWDYSYDTFPAAETPKVNYIITNGFSYKF